MKIWYGQLCTKGAKHDAMTGDVLRRNADSTWEIQRMKLASLEVSSQGWHTLSLELTDVTNTTFTAFVFSKSHTLTALKVQWKYDTVHYPYNSEN